VPDFGTWAPDLPEFKHDGLVTARNVYAGPLGYEPLRPLTAITSDNTIGTWLGGGAFEDSEGDITLIAGTTGGVEIYGSGTWSNVYSDPYSAKWFFAQFGDTLIGVSDADEPPVAYNMAAGTAALLGGSPPEASMIAIVRDFVFLAGKSDAQGTVHWSGINNSAQWTPGTNQSDSQPIPDGGPITGIAGGGFGREQGRKGGG